jgi:hypothetical protein
MPEPFQPPLSSRDERVAYNEAWERSHNERQAEWGHGFQGSAGFRCECWRADCTERIPLSAENWKATRAAPNRFAVAPHHVAEDVEAVVDKFAKFWLVEKLGKAGEVARQLA